MLVITDRQDLSQRLRRDLSFIGPCDVAPVDSFATSAPAKMIVSDVAIDNVGQIRRLRSAIVRHRSSGAPFLCLLRKDTHLARTQAFALGATKALPHDHPRHALIETVVELLEPHEPLETVRMRNSRTGVRKAGLALAEMMEAADRGARIEPKTLAAGTNLILQTVALNDVRDWLDVVGKYDDTTYQHSLLVAGLAASFSIKLGFGLMDRRRLAKAALLHDIGKAQVPIEILNKTSRLTPDEMAVMRTHATIGYDLLKQQGGFSPELLAVVRHHHEHLSGGGYPDGLTAAQIPDMVRLVTICDVYAALIERRPYKEPLSPERAYEIMQGMKGQLDMALLGAFHKVMLACCPPPPAVH